MARLSLVEILGLTPESFAAVFKNTAVKRLKLAGLLRNACIVAGNTGAEECVEQLARLAAEGVPMVRAHAVWALARLGQQACLQVLREAEMDTAVLAEYEAEGIVRKSGG
jgi:epoxyqueuosine reductase